ncbi:MAG: TonB-dependent receptor [Deltaproteobacteria bacterium]|nr:TonB-dependent receptor [Deltaproteobacteria bacterium]
MLRGLVGGVGLWALPLTALAQGVAPSAETVVRGSPRGSSELRGRSFTTVPRPALEETLPRSTPDALRTVPGVSVQQTAHGQASPYLRGLTGQQVVHVFDGVRLNNGTWRQGPNQYLFTVDPATLDRVEVVRGSASTRWGSDALGGAVLVYPVEPRLDSSRGGLTLHPRAWTRYGSADTTFGGRAELDAQLGRSVAILVGGGYRDVGLLESAGATRSPLTGRPPQVPLLEGDGRTQRGTGFREGTFDARVVARLSPGLHAVAAVYGYRQFDAPRTDQCPPPYAPERECLVYEEQFRTLAYTALRGSAGTLLPEVDLTASYQRHHERRRRDRPLSSAVNGFLDDVDTLGLSFRASTRRFGLSAGDRPTAALGLRWNLGVDAQRDQVASSAWITFTDVSVTRPYSRGQYLDGALWLQAGAFTEVELDLHERLFLRVGGRLSAVGAQAPGDPESGSRGVQRSYLAPVARAGLEFQPTGALSLHANLDQGFRAPNLDDLTARQQAGPGFQFENPRLDAERSLTAELGLRTRTRPVQLELWGWALALDGAVTRVLRGAEECPPSTPQCLASWSRYQLVNATGRSWIYGGELSLKVLFPRDFSFLATLAYAWGEGPDPSAPPSPDNPPPVPLSRIPPLNGTAQVRWQPRSLPLMTALVFRWAAEQTRLAPADRGDARIPEGGTAGWAVLDLRASVRVGQHLRTNLVLENLLDTPYRIHGSSINGPGRGVLLSLFAAW